MASARTKSANSALHERVMQGPVFAGVEAKRQRKDGSEIISISIHLPARCKGEIIGVLGIPRHHRAQARREGAPEFRQAARGLESTLRAVALTVETKDPRTAATSAASARSPAHRAGMGVSDEQITGLASPPTFTTSARSRARANPQQGRAPEPHRIRRRKNASPASATRC
jgi:hypothetical protein